MQSLILVLVDVVVLLAAGGGALLGVQRAPKGEHDVLPVGVCREADAGAPEQAEAGEGQAQALGFRNHADLERGPL